MEATIGCNEPPSDWDWKLLCDHVVDQKRKVPDTF